MPLYNDMRSTRFDVCAVLADDYYLVLPGSVVGSGIVDKRKAFTLIEVLVVIAIIGLLVSILIPSMSRARAASQRVACSSNLKQIGVVMRIYIGEHRDRMPHASSMPSISSLPLETDEAISISDVFAKRLGGDISIFKCPSDPGSARRTPPSMDLSYFETERSSYEYRGRMLGGRTTDEVARSLKERTGRVVGENTIWILRDYYNFHGKEGKQGARRYLYIDGHVGDYEN
jgi:prepilin-type N-terminal cleavage/methylation domain-containing protein